MRKGRRIRRVISLLLVFIMMMGLAACGKKTDSNSSKTDADSKNYVYSMTEIPIKLGESDISYVVIQGDKIYASAFNYVDTGAVNPRDGESTAAVEEQAKATITTEETATATTTDEAATATDEAATTATTDETITAEEVPEEGEAGYVESLTEVLVGVFDLEGTKISEYKVTLPAEAGTTGFTADANGNVYMVLDEYGKDTSNPDNIRDQYSLISYNEQGDENWRVKLGENIGPDDWYYVNQLMTNEDGNIVLQSNLGLEFYGADSKKINEVKLAEEESGNLICLKDGSFAIITYGENAMGIKKVDLATGKLSDTISFPFNSYNYSYYSGKDYDLYLVDSAGIYGFNLGDENYTKIMDYVDSDMYASNIYNICPIGDNSFFGTFYDETEGTTRCAKFTKVDPADIKDKITLTLGCNYLDSDVRKHVIEYNKASADYRIKVVDYSSYNTEDDYQAGQNKMNTDIASGNMPDILMTNVSMPLESYISKGLFADVNTFFEKDTELKKEDYLSNIWDALSKDGKLYQVAPSFYIFTVFGKTSEVGSESGWTMDDLQNLMASKGEDVKAFNEMTRQDVLNYSMWLSSSQFIDWATGKCSFDSEGFEKLLTFASQYPEEITYPEGDDQSYWENYQTMYREGRALLMPYTISSFDDYNSCEQGTFGGDITPIGFPTENKKGSALNFNSTFAISGKSKNQEEAWQFVRYFLTDEYQSKLEWCFPIKYSQLSVLAENAQKRPFYLDENGEKVEYDNTFYLNGVDVTITPMTKEKTDQVISFIESVDQIMSYDNNITDIIQEETAPYFSGQKNVKEVSDIIQSRIQIYVNENR